MLQATSYAGFSLISGHKPYFNCFIRHTAASIAAISNLLCKLATFIQFFSRALLQQTVASCCSLMTVGKCGTSCSRRATAEVAVMRLYVVVILTDSRLSLVATNAHLLPSACHICILFHFGHAFSSYVTFVVVGRLLSSQQACWLTDECLQQICYH